MSQPPTGPEGFRPAYPPQQPAAPGPQPSGGSVHGTPYGAPPAPQQYGPGQAAFAPPRQPPAPGGPVSAPPVPGLYAPMPAPLVSGPAYGQPMSVPPVSGPAFGQPTSAPPGSVPPFGAPAPGVGKGRTVLILAVVAGLLFVLSGVMSGLFVAKSNELDNTERRLSGQVSERDGTIAANTKEMEQIRAELQGAQDKLADTQQDLTGTRNDRDEQARQKKVIASCLDKLTTALAAAAANNKSAFDKASKGMDKVCDEAENYL
ncbi:hypothetical protein ABZ807_12700 [Micromonospora sp. NPDC047548]|uniref:hypothetical protein n=1 Tax=Micromonospora sp. NPDC047548 TaxID=3155624 RepID=UPI0033ECD6AD